MPQFLRSRCATALSALLGLGLLAGCQEPTPAEPGHEGSEVTPLLLISIDGFRHDYYDLTEIPAIDRLVAGGLKTDSLHHVFPTKTFPTHYTIVTGRHPGTHGVVANSMWDPRRDARFSLGNRDAVGDGYWYQGGEPIWVTAENQGLITATYFWPGSEARIHRVRPSYWKPYEGSVPHAERVEQVLAWLDLSESERPELLTLYFSAVDSMGHRHGPRADEVAAALAEIDGHLGTLLDGLEQRDLLDRINILLVSDHGMSRVDFDQYILLDDYLDLSQVTVSDWGPAAQIWATEMSADDIVAALDGAHPNLRVWQRDDIPARYRFGSHHRVPDVVAEADLEWMISNRPHMAGRTRYSLLGMHGWDPAWLEMHGNFVAHGPAFSPGSRAPAIRSIDLYALMSELLGIEPAEHEGSLAALAPYLHAADEIPYRVHRYVCQPNDRELEARFGPAHVALHIDGYAHVLDRVEEGRYEEVDLSFETRQGRARARIDGRELSDCLSVE